MSRALTATPHSLPDEAAAPGPDPALVIPDAETSFFAGVDWLFELGADWRALDAKIAKLAAQLADAELVQTYPESARKATERHERWKNDLRHIESEASLGRQSIGAYWQRIPPRRQRELKAEPAFPGAASVVRLTGEIWERARAGRSIPGRCPF